MGRDTVVYLCVYLYVCGGEYGEWWGGGVGLGVSWRWNSRSEGGWTHVFESRANCQAT